MTEPSSRIFESRAFQTFKHYPRLTATLRILLATLAIAVPRVEG
jgi:hypothetical protein